MTDTTVEAPSAEAPRPRKSGRTRDAIVEAAVRLFIARGTSAVTTNHIAAELGISPGNLYYHFRNKEEIVRAAYARHWSEADALLEPPPLGGGGTAGILESYVERTLGIILRWPFFFQDMAELCRRDPDFAAEVRETQRRWVAHLADVLRRLRAAGLVADDVPDGEIDLLAGNIWMVARSILDYTIAASDQPIPTEAAARRGVRHIFALVRPHLVPLARAALDAQLAGRSPV